MVVGKTPVLRDGGARALKARSVRVGGRRCAVGPRRRWRRSRRPGCKLGCATTARARAAPRDAGSLFVHAGRPASARGRRRLGLQGRPPRRRGRRGRPRRPFGTRRGCARRAGAVVLVRATGARRLPAHARRCRRPRAVARARPLRVTVRGYDDNGPGVAGRRRHRPPRPRERGHRRRRRARRSPLPAAGRATGCAPSARAWSVVPGEVIVGVRRLLRRSLLAAALVAGRLRPRAGRAARPAASAVTVTRDFGARAARRQREPAECPAARR